VHSNPESSTSAAAKPCRLGHKTCSALAFMITAFYNPEISINSPCFIGHLARLVWTSTEPGPNGLASRLLQLQYCYPMLLHRWNHGQKKKLLVVERLLTKIKFSASIGRFLPLCPVIHVPRNSIIVEDSFREDMIP
jgi:hypothetical protein